MRRRGWTLRAFPFLIFNLLVLLGCIQGWAASIDAVKADNGRTDIVISGTIALNDDERFATVAGTLNDDVTVWLEGPGGSLRAGLRIGTAIRLRGWNTAVADETYCASACGLVWLGGVKRSVGRGARIGFHAAWVETNGQKLETGVGNALVGSYLNRLGLTDAAIAYLTAASPDDAAWLTAEIAANVGIRASFDVPGRPALPGVQPISPSPPHPSPGEPATAPPPLLTPASPTPEALLGQLYADFPWSVHIDSGPGSGLTCVGRGCQVRLLAADGWTGPDSVSRRIVVGVAEVKGDCHACAAILGIGVFRRDDETWRKEIITPAVTRVGGYGEFSGPVRFADGGALGRVVRLEDSDMAQGVEDTSTIILAAVTGRYRQVLYVPSFHNLGGLCDTKEPSCRKRANAENYRSQVAIEPIAIGLLVQQTFTAAHPVPPASWTISPTGVVHQTSGGPATPGLGADARAALPPADFQQGQQDRRNFDAWVNGLQEAPQAGAKSWAGRRSLRNPGTCEPPAGSSPEWSTGCREAQERLARFDRRRKAEPEYRKGWNSL